MDVERQRRGVGGPIERERLRALVETLEARPDAIAAGSAIADIRHGQIYEVGGRIEPLFGQFAPWFDAQ